MKPATSRRFFLERRGMVGWRHDLLRNAGSDSAHAFIRALLFCPGFDVVANMRLAQKIERSRLPAGHLIARIIWRSIVVRYGCYISLGSLIGDGLFLPHPIGIVIGDKVSIGSNVTIYQGVTLGRRTGSDDDYPTIEDGVTIYAGAVILGAIKIGRDSVIAANSVVLNSVEADATVVGAPARPVVSRSSYR